MGAASNVTLVPPYESILDRRGPWDFYAFDDNILQDFLIVKLYRCCIGIFDSSYPLLVCIDIETVSTYMNCHKYQRDW